MADEVKNYTIQLEQIEIALLSNPGNEELQKLKQDLQEIIKLTQDLQCKTTEIANNAQYYEVPTNLTEKDSIAKSIQDIEEFVAKNKNKKKWRLGDVCLAKWNESERYSKAKINSIEPDGRVYVTYEDYENRGVTTLAELKEFTGTERVRARGENGKQTKLKTKEYRQRRREKKQESLSKLEAERETSKNQWLSFTAKAKKSKKTGIQTKSIFATSDSVDSKTGVGTCGIGGKPMTKFQSVKKLTKTNEQ